MAKKILTEEEAYEQIKNLWKQIQDLFKAHYDVNQRRLETYFEKPNTIQSLVIDYKQSRNQKKYIYVCTTDAYEINANGKEYNGDDVLFKVIDLVGVDKVKSMNITSTRSIPLVIDINEGKLPAGYKHYNEKFAVHTKTPTPEKAQQIKEILENEKIFEDVAIRIKR